MFMKQNFFRVMSVLILSSFIGSCASSKNSQAQKSSQKTAEKAKIETERSTDFYVANVTPEGELPSKMEYPEIQIEFSKPAVALKKLGEVSSKSSAAKIEPELKGSWRWYGTSVLSFVSSEKALPQKDYTLKVSPELLSSDGEKLSGQTVFHFHTEDLKLTSLRIFQEKDSNAYIDYSSVPLEAARKIVLYFNAEVDASSVKNHILVSDGKKNLKFSAKNLKDSDEKNSVLIELEEPPAENSVVEVTLEKGAAAGKNLRATEVETRQTFHTIVPFTLKSFTSYPPYAVFSAPLKEGSEKSLAENISTDLKDKNSKEKYKITEENIEIFGNALRIKNLPAEAGEKFNITLGENIFDIYGRTLGEEKTCKVVVPDAEDFALFHNQGLAVYSATENPKIEFSHQNIKGGWYEIVPISGPDGNAPKLKSARTEIKKGEKNKEKRELVDLKPFLENLGGLYKGALLFRSKVNLEGLGADLKNDGDTEGLHAEILQFTDIAATVRASLNKVVVRVTNVKTGLPVSGAQVQKYNADYPDDYSILKEKDSSSFFKSRGHEKTAFTDKNGIAEIALSPDDFENSEKNYGRTFCFKITTADDCLFYIPENIGSLFGGAENSKNMISSVFTQSDLFKPGETIKFKAVARLLENGKYSVPHLSGEKTALLKQNWPEKKIAETKVTFNENGTAAGEIKIPNDLKPGNYYLYVELGEGAGECSQRISVQFFEKLKFQAFAEIGNETPYFAGDRITAELSAEYLGGGALSGGRYSVRWQKEAQRFRPQNQKYADYDFGPELPYYYGYGGSENVAEDGGQDGEKSLNAEGKASSSVKTAEKEKSLVPYKYSAEFIVQDESNQSVSARAGAIVNPSLYYIGVKKLGGYFSRTNEKISFEFVRLSPEEKKVGSSDDKNPVKILLEKEEWKNTQTLNPDGTVSNSWKSEFKKIEEKETAAAESGNFSFTCKDGGSYRISLSSTDKNGNEVLTQKNFYVSGSSYFNPRNNENPLTLETDKELYEAGETARLLLQSPLAKGTYLFTLERDSIIREEILELDGNTKILEIPLTEDFVPVVYAHVSTYSTAENPDESKAYSADVEIHVSASAKSFDVKIEQNKTSYRPGGKVKIKMSAQKNGKPLENAELALVVEDRGVLDLTDFHVQNLADIFYNEDLFPDKAAGGDSRKLLERGDFYVRGYKFWRTRMMKSAMNFAADSEMALAAPMSAMPEMLKDEASSSDTDKFNIRSNFASTAAFVPFLTTDAQGNAEYEFTLPDNITTYRITVVGVYKDSFAKAEEELKAANPLSMRKAIPQVLRLNDESEAGVTLTNISDSKIDAKVSLKIIEGIADAVKEKSGEYANAKKAGKAELGTETSLQVEIGANSTKKAAFKIEAEKSGWITLEFTLKSEVLNEKVYFPLEIEKPYIFEKVASSGQILDGESSKTEKLVLPSDADDNSGNFYIQLDSTRLGVLRDAVDYVFHYPYGCMEQRTAAVLPLVSFGKYIKIFALESEVENPAETAQKEIASWAAVQNADGGFPYWPESTWGRQSSLYVSLRVAEILHLAKENGIQSGKIKEGKLLSFIEKESAKENLNSYARAYALYIQALFGKNVKTGEVESLAEKSYGEKNIPALEFCALACVEKGEIKKAEEILSQIRKFTTLTTRGIEIQSDGGFWCFLNSDSENYALLLELCTKFDKDSDLNPRIVYELLKMQKAGKGYWRSTAATCRVLVALDTYIKANNFEESDLNAKVLLGGNEILASEFKGIDAAGNTAEKTIEFSSEAASSLPKDSEIPLEISREGKGKLFYTMSLEYALPVEQQTARDEGISVYTEITDAQTGEKVEGGVLEEGKLYKEKVFISSTKRLEFTALRVPVPAGCEILNSAFRTTDSAASSASKDWSISYSGIFKDEYRFFWNNFYRGQKSVEFYFRAMQKGKYNVPPAKAECMYEEEIFGRTDGKVVEIK